MTKMFVLIDSGIVAISYIVRSQQLAICQRVKIKYPGCKSGQAIIMLATMQLANSNFVG